MSIEKDLAIYLANVNKYQSRILDYEHLEKTLMAAIILAHGNPNAFSRSRLQEMTALEFLITLAPNNIEFVYNVI